MRALAWLMALLLPLLFAAGCGDLSTVPTAPERAAVPSDHALTSCYGTIAGGVWCEPISNDPPECDPWMSLNWCQDDNCEMSAPGMGDPEQVGIAGCNKTGGPTPPPPGGGYYPPPPPPPSEPADTCRTGDAMVDDPDVYGQFDALWKQSLAQGVEMGGWIVRDGPNNYRLIPFQNAVNTACGVDIFEAPPANLVSMFHTHPWQLGQARMCDGAYTLYTGTPSPEDAQALQQLGISTGYFIDHTGIGKYTATGGEQANRISRCGY